MDIINKILNHLNDFLGIKNSSSDIVGYVDQLVQNKIFMSLFSCLVLLFLFIYIQKHVLALLSLVLLAGIIIYNINTDENHKPTFDKFKSFVKKLRK